MIDRRTMLKLSFLVPAALVVACAPRGKGERAAPTPAPTGNGDAGSRPDPLAAIRTFKLRPDTEPSFVFQARVK